MVGELGQNELGHAATVQSLRNNSEPITKPYVYLSIREFVAVNRHSNGAHQGQLKAFFSRIGNWDDDQKRRPIITVSECGYALDVETDDPTDIDLDIIKMESMRALAEHVVDEELFGTIGGFRRGFSARAIHLDAPFTIETTYRRFLGVHAAPQAHVSPKDFAAKVIDAYIERELRGRLPMIAEQYRERDTQE